MLFDEFQAHCGAAEYDAADYHVLVEPFYTDGPEIGDGANSKAQFAQWFTRHRKCFDAARSQIRSTLKLEQDNAALARQLDKRAADLDRRLADVMRREQKAQDRENYIGAGLSAMKDVAVRAERAYQMSR